MADETYAALAQALDRLPNGFPSTASRREIPLLRKIFSEEEARIASLMCGTGETFEAIAARAGLAAVEARRALMDMAKRGLVWVSKENRKLLFRLAPFVVGIYEAQLATMDRELALLFEEYTKEGGTAGLMTLQPALHRVVPASGSVPIEWVLPYDDVRAMLLGAASFSVRDCICRFEQDLLGSRACDAPLRNCLSFSSFARHERPDDISRERALAILDEAEDAGLVHTVSNVVEGLSYLCNCCGCCCAILRGITEHGIAGSVARANYAALIDAERCTGCGVCIARCQVGAIEERDGISVVIAERCIGCGLCATGCSSESVALRRLPDAEVVHPPVNFAAWEKERLSNRRTEGPMPRIT